MPKKAYAIVNQHRLYPGVRHFQERMKEALAPYGVDLSLLKTGDALIKIEDDGSISSILGECAFVLYLDKDRYAAYALEKQGFRLFNSPRSIELCDDKMMTYLALSCLHIDMPKTIAPPLNYTFEETDPDYLKRIGDELGFPLVAKLNYGSLGNNVFLLQNLDELIDFDAKSRQKPRLYQRFIASSKGKDFRLIVIGGKFVAGMMRYNDSDFRSNVAQGGKGYNVEIPPSYIEMAEKAATALKLDYAGVDILVGIGGKPILCEVNSNAFIDGIEKTTGIDVASCYAAYLMKKTE